VALYTDGTKGILQMLAGGSIYTPDWHISLGISTGNPFSSPVSGYEVAGSRVPLVTGWTTDPGYATNVYQDGVMSTQMVNVPTPGPASVRYYLIWDGMSATKFTWYGRLQNYDLYTEAGDYVRFPAGSLKIIIDY
jgi:hypothetical protein